MRSLPVIVAAVALTCGSPPPPPDDLSSLVDPIAQEALRAGPVAGLTVGIARGGREMFAKGYGVADLENAVPATADTVYRIQSATKSFTGAAILQLRDEGKLALDDPIGRFLSELPAAWRPVTVKQSLTHTGGLPNYHGKLFRENVAMDLTAAEWVHSMADRPLLFEPGTGWSYSNVGYDILGLIIEKLSGVSYGEYVRAHMTAPLGMAHTRIADPDAVTPHRARSYVQGANGELRNARSWGIYGTAAGRLCSTVGDLLKWEQALRNATIMSKDSIRLMETPSRLAGGLRVDYGLGSRLGSIGTHRIVAHSGDGEGWTAAGLRVDDADLTVAVLTNTESYPRHAALIAGAVARAVLRLPPFGARADVPLPDIAALAGAYQADSDLLQLTAENGKLTLKTGFAPPMPLAYDGDGVFVVEPVPALSIEIVRDDHGDDWAVLRGGGEFLLAARRQK